MSGGFMYILECADGSYYTGSAKDMEKRLSEHRNMIGAHYTKSRLPVRLVYYEEYPRIDEAFYREKQVQGWSRKKKEALIKGCNKDLPLLSKNYTQFGRPAASTGSATGESAATGESSATETKSESTDGTDCDSSLKQQ